VEYGNDGYLVLVVQRRFMKDYEFVLSGVGDDTAYTQGTVKMPANYNESVMMSPKCQVPTSFQDKIPKYDAV
jgi:hypothetical protein